MEKSISIFVIVDQETVYTESKVINLKYNIGFSVVFT